jgi:hypothetical protein
MILNASLLEEVLDIVRGAIDHMSDLVDSQEIKILANKDEINKTKYFGTDRISEEKAVHEFASAHYLNRFLLLTLSRDTQ